MSKTIVGIDIGYGDVKIVSDDLLSVKDEGCLASFPSLIARARGGDFALKGKDRIHTIKVGGKHGVISLPLSSPRRSDCFSGRCRFF